MKGIILAGGKATRLYPLTKGVCKQLLPVYNKPMIYYPLSVLMLANIRDILIISTPDDIDNFKKIFGDGKSLGLNIQYAVQKKPKGIAEAFIVAETFIGKDSVCLILGDNIFYGDKLTELLRVAKTRKKGATVFAYTVKDPERYGVVTFNNKMKATSIAEKPKKPKSSWAITGLYFYDNSVVKIAKGLKPSKRGELEITDVNKVYLKKKKLNVQLLGHGYAWLDTGTYDSLINASMFIKTIEERQGMKIGCVEQIAYKMKFINAAQLLKIAKSYKTEYGKYLKEIVKNGKSILIFGKGYIGTALQKHLKCKATARHIATYKDIEAEIKKHQPKTIINCIGYTGKNNVDDCEKDIDGTLSANTFVPILMAEAAVRHKIKFVHISSGCIYNYDYKKQRPISETLVPDYYTLYYSRTKIYVENILEKMAKRYNILIPRIRIPLDNKPHPKNIIDKLLKYKTVLDIPNSITYIPDLLKALKHLIKIDAKGIYNVATKGGLRYPDLMDEYKKYHPDFQYSILPLKKLKLNRTNLLLSTQKLEKSGFKVRTTREVIKEAVKQYVKSEDPRIPRPKKNEK